MRKRHVYFFGLGKADGSSGMKNLLGGKGAGLAEMTNLGVPVPPGFTISTRVCSYFSESGGEYPDGLREEVGHNLERIEEIMKRRYGDASRPLLVSVRSGARVSMPGMMDTVLNLGLNDGTVKGLIEETNNPRFGYDCYRRFVQMYGDVVMDVSHDEFEKIIANMKDERKARLDVELSSDDLEELVARFRSAVREQSGTEFPEGPEDQLWGAIGAVFQSWSNKRAVEYRRIHGIPDDWGTAVNVQAMVFGNLGEGSATGVAFTRNPATGENLLYGEFLENAQGEDVVAGTRTPNPISIAQKGEDSTVSLEEKMPDIYVELTEIRDRLETHYKDIQDVEFTVEKGKLWILQTRTAKRTSLASVRTAVDMVDEGLILKEHGLLRIEAGRVEELLHRTIDPSVAVEVAAKGLPASPGTASGQVVFSAEDAVQLAGDGRKLILVRTETSAEDIAGIAVSEGILTARGGMTSHAAVVTRGMGKPCVAGCEAVSIDYDKQQFRIGGSVVRRGNIITIDGATGRVILGEVPTVEPSIGDELSKSLAWADEVRRLGVRANADNPKDARTARRLGAEGIGLCRTEHMFFTGERIDTMREMILSEDEADRRRALEKILPLQREDFAGIFREMYGLPVIIRTLDPPLHEFLPKEEEDIQELAEKMGLPRERLRAKVESLREVNPMLGHRGCRLGISYPEITETQVKAIFQAACRVSKEGVKVFPEVMIPLVATELEFIFQKEVIQRTATEVMREEGTQITYKVGTMIELPRAALIADRIAREADFFSFGTNDLTQTTLGFSRDDVDKIVSHYIDKGILEESPFRRIDRSGVGELINVGITRARWEKPDMEIGICGEHGGDPSSVEFFHAVGMNYVSCSPYRVPTARLAAAQAALKDRGITAEL